ACMGEKVRRRTPLELVADAELSADVETEGGDGECYRGPSDSAQGAGGGLRQQVFDQAGCFTFLTAEHAHSPGRHGSMIAQVLPGPMVRALICSPGCVFHSSLEGFDTTKERYFPFRGQEAGFNRIRRQVAQMFIGTVEG